MTIQKAVLIDQAADLLLKNVKEIQQKRSLNIDDMESIVLKVLNDIREEKQKEYASIILDLTYHMQEQEKELQDLRQRQSLERTQENDEPDA